MPRPRKQGNDRLPNNVYIDKKNYVYREYKGRKDGKNIYSDRVVLGPTTMPLSKLQEAVDSMAAPEKQTLGWLFEKFQASEQFKKKSADWQYTKDL